MRIVHIVWELGTGGVETMLVDIVNEQIKTEVVAVAVVNEHFEQFLLHKIDSRCTVKLCGRKRGSRNPIPWIKLNTFLFCWKPDIIHFHLEGMRKMVIHPAPKVFTIHNLHTSGAEFGYYKQLYAISEGVRLITQQQGYNAILVWNGIRTDDIKTKEDNFFTPGSLCKIVCVGRLYTPHKGQDVLIGALGLLKQQGVVNYHLDVIGDGESHEQLERLVSELGLKNNVSFLGQRDRTYIYEHLKDYDLFVLPSRSEGFGLSAAEAICAKLPVIVCDLESVKPLIADGRYGVMFHTENIQSLADKIIFFLQKGVEISDLEEARQYIKDNFEIRRTASKYIKEYLKCIRN